MKKVLTFAVFTTVFFLVGCKAPVVESSIVEEFEEKCKTETRKMNPETINKLKIADSLVGSSINISSAVVALLNSGHNLDDYGIHQFDQGGIKLEPGMVGEINSVGPIVDDFYFLDYSGYENENEDFVDIPGTLSVKFEDEKKPDSLNITIDFKLTNTNLSDFFIKSSDISSNTFKSKKLKNDKGGFARKKHSTEEKYGFHMWKDGEIKLVFPEQRYKMVLLEEENGELKKVGKNYQIKDPITNKVYNVPEEFKDVYLDLIIIEICGEVETASKKTIQDVINKKKLNTSN